MATTACALADDDNPYFAELPVIASASRLPQRLADAPTSVTVIDRELIKASGARDLNDIFRLVPGFQTYPNNTEAARVTYHGLSDDKYSSRLQVLIDGRSMYSPLFGGGINWATLPVAIEDIERIEVIRGTNAVSYGTNAFLGVINIITIDPSLVRGTSLALSQGNQNIRDYYFRTGGRLGEAGDFRFTYKQVTDDALNDRGNWSDSYASRVFDLRADLTVTDRDSLQISLGQAEGITTQGRTDDITMLGSPPFSIQINANPMRRLRQTDQYFQLLWRHALSADSDMQLRYAHVEDRSGDPFQIVLPALPPFIPSAQVYTINQSGDAGIRDELEFEQNVRLAASSRVAWGASWRNDEMRSSWSLPGQGTVKREIFRLFGNLEWKPNSWFTGNLGLAGENDTLAGFNAMPRFSANFHLNPENTIRIGYSQAFRTPDTVAFRGQEKVQLPAPLPAYVFYRGNANLPSERLDTWEIGFLGDWRDWRASLDMRLFDERIHNRLFDLNVDNTGSDTQSTVPIQNVRIKGLEFQFKWQPLENTRVVLNQTISKIQSSFLPSALALPNTDLTAPGVSAHLVELTEHSLPGTATSLLLVQKLPFGLDLSLGAYWQDRMKWTTNTWSPAYERYDLRLGYPFHVAGWAGEVAMTVQSLNGAHREYKASDTSAYDRIVDRRQWVSLRLDF